MSAGVRLYAGTQHGLFVWRSRHGQWDQVYSGLTDRVMDWFAGCRQRPERVFVTVPYDGLYRTDDGGARWSRVLQADVRCVTVDPSDERVVYAGTCPVGLYRSEDGGDHWEPLAALPAMPQEVRQHWWTPYPPHTGHVRDVFVHPDDPNVIYLPLEHGGVVRSLDRGATWEDVSQGIEHRDMHSFACLPGRGTHYLTASARGLYASGDPARGWERRDDGIDRDYFNSFVFLPPASAGGPPAILVAAGDGTPGDWRRELRGARTAIFRSDDAGQSWQRVGQGLPAEMDAMIWPLQPHPHEPNGVFAGTGRINRGDPLDVKSYPSPGLTDGPGEIWQTRDRGDTWEPVALEVPAVRALWVAPD